MVVLLLIIMIVTAVLVGMLLRAAREKIDYENEQFLKNRYEQKSQKESSEKDRGT
jgi:hypothetical protein